MRAGGFEVREPRVGELGWVVSRHGEVYAESYDWDASFENRMVLWTHESLTAARCLYAAAGFRLVSAEPEAAFGHANGAEDWELEIPHLRDP